MDVRLFHQLADGRRLFVRPLRAADAPRLVDLCTRLSPETIRRRFLRPRAQCSPAEALVLASVDQVRRVAIALVTGRADDARIVAVGRFHADDEDGTAELSLLVEDAYQQLGLGRRLLAELLHEAHRRRLHVLDGYVLFDNAPLLHLLRTSGRPLEVAWHGGDVLDFKLQVEPAQRHDAA
jgi:acetyltransferase